MPGQVVDPSLFPQLGHDGVDPGEPGAAVGPLGEGLWGKGTIHRFIVYKIESFNRFEEWF